MEETVPYINTDENKAIVKDLTTTCRQYCEGFSQAPVIEYINNHFKRIFNKNGSEHTLVDVVLEFIYEHCGGINKSVWIFLADRCSQRLLGDYKIVKKILLRNNYGPTMLDKMIKIENPADLIKYRLDTVFNVLSDIILNQKNEDLNATAKKKTDHIYDVINSLNEDSFADRSLIINDGIYRELLNYLKKIKDRRANAFSQKVKESNKKLNSWLKTNGVTLRYEIPVGDIIDGWRNKEHWCSKLLLLTHKFRTVNDNVKAFSLIEECKKSNTLLDFCSSNMPTDDYFTYSLQLSLRGCLSFYSGVIRIILLDENDATEYYNLILSAAHHIQTLSRSNRKETLLTDVDILTDNIEIIRNNKNNPNLNLKGIYYGTTMLACSLSEKLLKIVYEDLTMDIRYVSTDNLGLGSLLNSKDSENPLIPVFGANHLKHLAFFLCKVGDNRVGDGIRNSLAHLSDDIEAKLGDQLLPQILWIFTDILNTVFWHYADKAKNAE